MATEVSTGTRTREIRSTTVWGWIITLVFGALMFVNGAIAPFTWANIMETKVYLFLALGSIVAGIAWDGYRSGQTGRMTWMSLWTSVIAVFAIGAIMYLTADPSVGGAFMAFGVFGAVGVWLARPR